MPKRSQKEEIEAAEPSSSGTEQSSGSGSDDGSSGSESGSEFPDVSDEEEESSGSGDDVQELQVDFEFFSPEEKDFLGLKSLLVPYLNSQEFDSSALIDAIIAEGDIASVVKTDSDDDPIAIMSVLSTGKYKEARFMKQILQFLLDSCPKQAPGTRLAELCKQAFESEGTGLIMNERFINAPPKLSPPLVMFLMDAIKERSQPGQPSAAAFDYKRFLLATRVYMDKGASTQSGAINTEEGEEGPAGRAGGTRGASTSSIGGGASSSSSGQPAKRQKQHEGGSSSSSLPAAAEIIFSRPEDQYFHQFCSWYYTFPVESRPVGKDGLQQCRLVMLINADRVADAQRLLDEEVGNMARGAAGGQQEVAKMAEEAMEAAAAAGAGKGAGSKKKKAAGKAKAVQL